MRDEGWFLAIMVVLIVAVLGVFVAVAAHTSRATASYDAICKRAGYDNREILSDGRAYCVDYWTEYHIVPFETVAAEAGG